MSKSYEGCDFGYHEVRVLQVVPGTEEKPGVLAICEIEKLFLDFFKKTGDRVKRSYYIHNNTDQNSGRGGHYHPQGKVEFMTCMVGEAKLVLHWRCAHDDMWNISMNLSGDRPVVVMIPPFVWHQVYLKPNSVLHVMANCEYSPGESIQGELPLRSSKKVGFFRRMWEFVKGFFKRSQ